jgi:hypothetical protein
MVHRTGQLWSNAYGSVFLIVGSYEDRINPTKCCHHIYVFLTEGNQKPSTCIEIFAERWEQNETFHFKRIL